MYESFCFNNCLSLTFFSDWLINNFYLHLTYDCHEVILIECSCHWICKNSEELRMECSSRFTDLFESHLIFLLDQLFAVSYSLFHISILTLALLFSSSWFSLVSLFISCFCTIFYVLFFFFSFQFAFSCSQGSLTPSTCKPFSGIEL